MDAFFLFVGYMLGAACTGFGIRWGFWIWDNLAQLLADIGQWWSSRRRSGTDPDA